ncbi:MAG TPA: hypothetical protein K8V90_01795 [Romboutsia timonensis]|uniref:Uncharacterized protein n=1 Tax=Romboutsia timonensis TaxID=1776391 RepID=A0A921MZ93_9FIRM|nr:hypothetical protein [Romboutsia timonensis]
MTESKSKLIKGLSTCCLGMGAIKTISSIKGSIMLFPYVPVPKSLIVFLFVSILIIGYYNSKAEYSKIDPKYKRLFKL